MMSMKKMVSSNKAGTYMVMTAIGAAMGMTAAKMVVDHCSCMNQMKCKAKKAFKTMEETLLD